MIALYIFVGGGLGALGRWGMTKASQSAFPQFPTGIFICNLLGCFLIGVMAGFFPKATPLQTGVVTGFLGGFTTYSSFSLESLKLIQNNNFSLFFTHIFATTILGIALTFLGLLVSK